MSTHNLKAKAAKQSKKPKPTHDLDVMDDIPVSIDITNLVDKIMSSERYQSWSTDEDTGKQLLLLPVDDYDMIDLFTVCWTPDDIRYAIHGASTKWFMWDGKKWTHVEKGVKQHIRMAKDAVHALYTEILRPIYDGIYTELVNKDENELTTQEQAQMIRIEKTRKYMSDLASKVSVMRNLEYLITSLDDDYIIRESDFDCVDYILNCQNGMVDLRTMEILPHDPKMLCAKFIDVPFRPNVDTTEFQSLLSMLSCNRSDWEEFLQLCFGFTVFGRFLEKKLITLVGEPDSLKSSFLRYVLKVLGEYGLTSSDSLITSARGNGHTSTIDYHSADLRGVRFAPIFETPRGFRWNAKTVKTLAGGDVISARQIYGAPMRFDNYATLWVCSNHTPIIDTTDAGVVSRLILFPFDARPKLSNKAADYWQTDPKAQQQILAWLILGAHRYWNEFYEKDLTISDACMPQCCQVLKSEELDSMDEVLMYLDDHFATTGKDTDVVALKTLHTIYMQWYRSHPLFEHGRPLGIREFTRALVTKGFEKFTTTKEHYCHGGCVPKNVIAFRHFVPKHYFPDPRDEGEKSNFSMSKGDDILDANDDTNMEKFLSDRCIRVPLTECETETQVIRAYRQWCKANGVDAIRRDDDIGLTLVGVAKNNGWEIAQKMRKRDRTVIFRGIELKKIASVAG